MQSQRVGFLAKKVVACRLKTGKEEAEKRQYFAPHFRQNGWDKKLPRSRKIHPLRDIGFGEGPPAFRVREFGVTGGHDRRAMAHRTHEGGGGDTGTGRSQTEVVPETMGSDESRVYLGPSC